MQKIGGMEHLHQDERYNIWGFLARGAIKGGHDWAIKLYMVCTERGGVYRERGARSFSLVCTVITRGRSIEVIGGNRQKTALHTMHDQPVEFITTR